MQDTRTWALNLNGMIDIYLMVVFREFKIGLPLNNFSIALIFYFPNIDLVSI